METDYFISARRMDKDDKHIESVRVHPNVNGGVGLASSWPRETVVEAIEGHGKVFYTVYKRDGQTDWTLGAQVEVVTIDRQRYLKTKRNSTKADNLDELPEY